MLRGPQMKLPRIAVVVGFYIPVVNLVLPAACDAGDLDLLSDPANDEIDGF